ncbi:hypothetical protein BI347_10040 [Chromobacterium sphagni]|uniref:Uncharacterized protein n=1 Tax=Chromobacterium sphagni TaxID=1903179 RepID=A0A1S1X2T0_9NEIS|nr:hypothetical protein BI347_10040 [Chromobacterium sphagni]
MHAVHANERPQIKNDFPSQIVLLDIISQEIIVIAILVIFQIAIGCVKRNSIQIALCESPQFWLFQLLEHSFKTFTRPLLLQQAATIACSIPAFAICKLARPFARSLCRDDKIMPSRNCLIAKIFEILSEALQRVTIAMHPLRLFDKVRRVLALLVQTFSQHIVVYQEVWRIHNNDRLAGQARSQQGENLRQLSARDMLDEIKHHHDINGLILSFLLFFSISANKINRIGTYDFRARNREFLEKFLCNSASRLRKIYACVTTNTLLPSILDSFPTTKTKFKYVCIQKIHMIQNLSIMLAQLALDKRFNALYTISKSLALLIFSQKVRISILLN